MSALRRIAVAVGLVALAWGLAFAFAPSLARALPVRRVLVLVAAGFAGFLAYRSLQRRHSTPIENAATDDPEDRGDLPSPGEDVDLALDRGTIGLRTLAAPGGNTLQDRLEAVAVPELMRRHNCDRAAAEELLATGAWTDDPVAAAYFADDPEVETPWYLPRAVGVLLGRPSDVECARRAIDELAGEP